MSPAFFRYNEPLEWMLQSRTRAAHKQKNKYLHDLLGISAGSILEAGDQAGER
jgi:hypothetical protein